MRLGTLIRKWRAVEEKNLRDVAKDVGIGVSTLSRIENGEQCDSGTLTKLLAWVLCK